MKDRYALRFVLIVIATIVAGQAVALDAFARSRRPPGLPNYTHPTDSSARVEARDRAWAMWDAVQSVTDDESFRSELWRVCKRESMCNWQRAVDHHRGETAARGRLRWSRAVKKGWLRPEECEHHQLGDDPKRWTVRGPYGTATAYVLRHVSDCDPPEILLDPYTATAAALGHMRHLCQRHGACDCESRARWWAGPGRWDKRDERHKLRSAQRQCGPLPWWRWIAAWAVDIASAVSAYTDAPEWLHGFASTM